MDHVGPMHMPRLLRDSLIQLASLRPSPDTPLSLTLSDPARSTITRELRTMLVIRLDRSLSATIYSVIKTTVQRIWHLGCWFW